MRPEICDHEQKGQQDATQQQRTGPQSGAPGDQDRGWNQRRGAGMLEQRRGRDGETAGEGPALSTRDSVRGGTGHSHDTVYGRILLRVESAQVERVVVGDEKPSRGADQGDRATDLAATESV